MTARALVHLLTRTRISANTNANNARRCSITTFNTTTKLHPPTTTTTTTSSIHLRSTLYRLPVTHTFQKRAMADSTTAPAAAAADNLPIQEKPSLEKRPSHVDLHEQPPKKQKTEEEPAAATAPSSSSTTVEDATAAAVTSVPTTSAPTLQVKKLSEKARLPTRGSAFAAGYDVYSSHVTTIPARSKALVDTDISIAVPAGTYGRIAPRSGLAVKNFIDVGAGVIDADYRGQVKILLFNHSDTDFEVKEGDRVAQLILERIYTPEVVEVQELAESVRGAGGFGSTGI